MTIFVATVTTYQMYAIVPYVQFSSVITMVDLFWPCCTQLLSMHYCSCELLHASLQFTIFALFKFGFFIHYCNSQLLYALFQ